MQSSETRDELYSAFIQLSDFYRQRVQEEGIEYLDIEISELLLWSLSRLLTHVREDNVHLKPQRNWTLEMKRAHRLLKKYARDLKKEDLRLKREYISNSYDEFQDFMPITRLNPES